MDDKELFILLFVLFLVLEKTAMTFIIICVVYMLLKKKNENFNFIKEKLQKKILNKYQDQDENKN